MLTLYARQNTHHQTNFKEIRGYTHQDVDLTEEVEIQGGHAIVIGDTREEVHENELTVSFASITRLLLRGCLNFGSTFYDDDGWCPASGNG